MFMTREELDAPVGTWGASGAGDDQAKPLMAASGSFSAGSRPGTSYSRSGTAELHVEDEENNTPMSAATRLQKMQQQRARMLQKQRSGIAQPLAGSMVQANESVPAMESRASMGSTLGSMNGAARPSTASTAVPTPMPGAAPQGPEPQAAKAAALAAAEQLQALTAASRPTTASFEDPDEMDCNAVIMPGPEPTPEETKEDEKRRRFALQDKLMKKGIDAEFDPTPSGGPPVPMGPISNFDIASIPSSEMKSFLLSPTPKHAGMIECRIIRERSGLSKLFPKYILQSESGVFLMSAKKQTHNKTSNYTITMSANDGFLSKDNENTLGKLRSDFLGLEFVAYSAGMNPKKIETTSNHNAIQWVREELLAVQYSSSLWGTKPRGPRKMNAVIPRVQPNSERLVCRTLTPEVDGLSALQKKNREDSVSLIDVYHNKPPKWNESIGAFVLNFNKRVTQASVKNFQLTNAEEPETVFLQFGRVGKDVFNMDFRHPFSPYQAFAICLSSFDYKLCCE